MKKNRSGQTAFGAAITRYLEQYQPEKIRLFNDDMVKYLLPRSFILLLKIKFIRNWLWRLFDKPAKGVYGAIICRTKYIDQVTELIKKNHIQQVIILGSGLDTRPYRLKALKEVKVFEVDLAWVQDSKVRKLKKHFGSLPANITYVSNDFNSQPLGEVLQQHNFNFSEPAFIIWEGVTQYITKDAVEETLDFVSKTPDNSCLVFTYILEGVINRASSIEGADKFMDLMDRKKSPWLFGIGKDNVAPLLARYHLKLKEDVGASYFQENYLKEIGRQLRVTEMERIVLAKVSKSQ